MDLVWFIDFKLQIKQRLQQEPEEPEEEEEKSHHVIASLVIPDKLLHTVVLLPDRDICCIETLAQLNPFYLSCISVLFSFVFVFIFSVFCSFQHRRSFSFYLRFPIPLRRRHLVLLHEIWFAIECSELKIRKKYVDCLGASKVKERKETLVCVVSQFSGEYATEYTLYDDVSWHIYTVYIYNQMSLHFMEAF